MIRIPEVVVGADVFPFISRSIATSYEYAWAFGSAETGLVVHGDGVSGQLGLVKKEFPAKPIAGGISHYPYFYVLCDDGIVYEYLPRSRQITRSWNVGKNISKPWIDVTVPVYLVSKSTAIVFVIVPGDGGIIHIIRIPDGQVFHCSFGQTVSGCVGHIVEANDPNFYPDIQPSSTFSPETNTMGPLVLTATTDRSIFQVAFTPVDGAKSLGKWSVGNMSNIKRLVNAVPTPINPTSPLPPLPVTPLYVSIWLSLRKMVAGYSGPCLRVRRSLDNAEKDIGFDSWGLVDETELLAFCGIGSGYVARWYNQGPAPAGQEYLSQPSANAQLRIVTSGAIVRNSAGMPAMRGDIGKDLFVTFAPDTMKWTEQHCFCGIVLERDSGQSTSNANMYGVGMTCLSGSSYCCVFTGYIDGSTFYLWSPPNRPTVHPKAWRWTPDPKHYYICAVSSFDFVHRDKGSMTPHEEVYQTISPSAVPAVNNISDIGVTCFHPLQIDFLQGWLSEVVLQSDPVYGWTHNQMRLYFENASTFWGVPSW